MNRFLKFLIALALSATATAVGKSNFFGIPIPEGGGPVTFSKTPPAELKTLGSMAGDLVLWAGLDSLENGGLTWSKEPRAGMFTTVVAAKADAGRAAIDFSAAGSILKLDPPVALGPRFTIAAWVLLPAPKANGVLFHGAHSVFLAAAEKGFTYRAEKVKPEDASYAAGAAPLSGWHHVALSSNGREMTLYYDARKAGVAPLVIQDTLEWIGNQPDPAQMSERMAGAMDDLFVFGKELTVFEIGALMKFRPPPKKR